MYLNTKELGQMEEKPLKVEVINNTPHWLMFASSAAVLSWIAYNVFFKKS